MMTTTDLWFASWLIHKGHQLAGFSKLSPRRGSYQFELSEAEWATLKLAFVKSDLSKHKQIQQELKDLLY